jgi:hypothetical protein
MMNSPQQGQQVASAAQLQYEGRNLIPQGLLEQIASYQDARNLQQARQAELIMYAHAAAEQQNRLQLQQQQASQQQDLTNLRALLSLQGYGPNPNQGGASGGGGANNQVEERQKR